MKSRFLSISSRFYINYSPPCEGPNPSLFQFVCFLPSSFTLTVYQWFTVILSFILPSRCFHTWKLVIQSEAKDLGNTNLSTP